MPKSHPSSDETWIEWRVSFSLVEKEIFRELDYLLRKVYVICKTITEKWKKEYNFPRYLLKTTFLWTLEDNLMKLDEKFTEDNIISMISKVFICLEKYFKENKIHNYFIPEMNILEQYSKEDRNKFKTLEILKELKILANERLLFSRLYC